MLVLQHLVLRLLLFTIKAEHEKNPRKQLDFIKIGGWRVSTYADTKLPNELYQVVENQILEIQTSILYYYYLLQKREIQIDENLLYSKMEKVKQVMTRRLFAGAGWSHICQ